ncbi:MAG: hypothetical protein AAF631_14115, partial [Pseudomonadota bacterium]
MSADPAPGPGPGAAARPVVGAAALIATPEALRWMQRLVLLVFALALVRDLLPPNGFSGTVLLFDYEFGLVRRGLLGELANLYWGKTVTPGEVFAVSAAMSLLGLSALLVWLGRSLLASRETVLLALIFVTSFGFAAVVGTTGYMDMVLIALTLGAAATDPNRASGLVARVVVTVVGV